MMKRTTVTVFSFAQQGETRNSKTRGICRAILLGSWEAQLREMIDSRVPLLM